MKKAIIILALSATLLLCGIFVTFSTSYTKQIKGETKMYYDARPDVAVPLFACGYGLLLLGSAVLGKEFLKRR